MAKEKKSHSILAFTGREADIQVTVAANSDLSKASTGRVCGKAEEVEMMLEVGQGAWYLGRMRWDS